MGIEYYTFDRVLKELQMGEDELKRLVSEGEIRAFRDEDKMKFKKSDIEGLKKGRMTEPTIILPTGGGGGDDEAQLDDESSEVLLVEDDTSETLLDIDELEEESSSSTSVPTVDFTVEDTGSETLTEELVFDEDSSGDFQTEDLGGQETMIDDDTGMNTEPIQLEEDEDDEDGATMAAPPPVSRRSSPRGSSRSSGAGAEVSHNPVMSAVLVFSAIVLLYGSFIVVNLIQEEDNAISGPLTDQVAKIFPTADTADGTAEIQKKTDSEKEKYVRWRQDLRAGKIDTITITPTYETPKNEEKETTGG